jgi:LuxR family maltose regulon positive regulatory protein
MFHGLVQTEILRSTGLYMMGDRGGARMVIEKIIPLAEKENYFRPFVDCWPLAPSFFVDVARDSRSPLPAAVLKACGFQDNTTLDEHRTVKGLRQALTPRETEILRLIAAGYKKGEIAGRTFVSPDTVKTHTRHIFEKLDARTKAEAIYRARQSGIID